MSTEIGRLRRVELREVWKHEAHNFTQWLEHNVDLLSDAVGLSLTVTGRERAAGAFACDLVAEDEAGNVVVIENQLERSNHDHLGKVITYLSALGAKTAIWVVSDPRSEHVGAITWLNDSSSASFYMVKVEAVRIGNSAPAPIFTLIAGPTAEIKETAAEKQDVAERMSLRKQWWATVLDLSRARSRTHANLSPNMRGYIGAGAGVRGLSFNFTVNQHEAGAELYIDMGDFDRNKATFDQLHAQRGEIEAAFGGPLSWERLDSKRACRIAAVLDGVGYRSPPEDWRDAQEDQVDAMVRLEATLRPRIEQWA